jgi:prepilin-type N-terminal cleavage/methylation domain-containing protein
MRRRVARTQAGYTIIEVMIALTLLAIGTTGIIAMQKVTTVANRDAKNLVIASQVARTWLERLRTDGVQWNHPSSLNPTSDLAETKWLNNVNGTWFRPVDDALGSPAADALGNDVRDVNLSQAAFCTNVRLTWLYGPPVTVPAPYLIRAEVRVYWLRDGAGGVIVPGNTICNPTIDLASVTPALDRYHFVYLATAVAQNQAQ